MITRRQERPLVISTHDILQFQFFYRFQGKSFSFSVCYKVSDIKQESETLLNVSTTSLVFGRLLEIYFL